MVSDALVAAIATKLKVLKLSERKACLRAGLHVDTIRNLKRGHAAGVDKLAKLEQVLDFPSGYLTALAASGEAVPRAPLRVDLRRVYVRGAVQGGVWRDAIEWPSSDWYALPVPTDERWPDAERFGLEVRGSSMDRVYPEGTIVVCIRYGDIGRPPRPGERVICLRRDSGGEYEATIKEYQTDEQGRHILWPRSSDPDFQQPIVLTGAVLPVASGHEVLPGTASAGRVFDDGAEPDLVIAALVTGSWRRE